jgi:hypothetical protein
LDYEGEMVAVIGTGGRHISEENALDQEFVNEFCAARRRYESWLLHFIQEAGSSAYRGARPAGAATGRLESSLAVGGRLIQTRQ